MLQKTILKAIHSMMKGPSSIKIRGSLCPECEGSGESWGMRCMICEGSGRYIVLALILCTSSTHKISGKTQLKIDIEEPNFLTALK